MTKINRTNNEQAQSATVVRRRDLSRTLIPFTLIFVVSATLLSEFGWLTPLQLADLSLALPVVYLLGVAGCLVWSGRPSTWRQVVLFLLCNAAMLGCLLVLRSRDHRWYVAQAVAVGFRCAVAAAWLLSCGGAVLLVETLRRGTLRWKPCVPACLRLGLAALFVTVVLESTAWLLEPFRSARELVLPDLPPAADSDKVVVAAVGGSTMLGFPYAPNYGIADVAVWQLRQAYPGRSIELRNLALTGANLVIAADNLKRLANAPDLMIVYSGHNEFFHEPHEMALSRRTNWGSMDRVFRWSPTFRIVNRILAQYQMNSQPVEGPQQLIGEPLCEDHILVKRRRRYADRLKQLLAWANDHHVKVVFCSPVADEADFEPNQSRCLSCSELDKAEIANSIATIREWQRQGDDEQALQMCLRLLDRFPDVAELHFRAGECLRELGELPQARAHFESALNLDQFPIRATGDYREAGLQAAAEYGVAILNSESVLRQHAAGGVLGENFFLDGVHPNLAATFLLGQAVADIIVEQDLLPLSGLADIPLHADFAASTQDLGMDAQSLAQAYRTVSGVLDHYAGFRTYDQKRRMQKSAWFRRMAEQLEAGELVPGAGDSESLDEGPTWTRAGNAEE